MSMRYACGSFRTRQRKAYQHARRAFILEPHALHNCQHERSCTELTLADTSTLFPIPYLRSVPSVELISITIIAVSTQHLLSKLNVRPRPWVVCRCGRGSVVSRNGVKLAETAPRPPTRA